MTTSPTPLRRRPTARRAGPRALAVGALLLPLLLAFGALPATAAAADDPLATTAPAETVVDPSPAPEATTPVPDAPTEPPATPAAPAVTPEPAPDPTPEPAPEPAPEVTVAVAAAPRVVKVTTAPRTAAPKAAAPASNEPAPAMAMAAAPVESRLGTADNFAILAGSTITNSGRSVVVGDVGLHPGTAVTGFASCTGAANCVDHTGGLHITDGVAQQAKADLLTAYNTLVGLEGTCTPIPVELGGTTLTPGVYCSPTFGLTGTLTLSGIGEFIFLTGAGGSALNTASGSAVRLIDGADSCGVYWQVASSAVIGEGSAFAGNILAQTSISFGTGATLDGSALAMDGAVTLIGNTITDSRCGAVAPPDGTPTPTPDETPSPTPDETPSPTPDDPGTPTPDDPGSPTPDDPGTPTPDDPGDPTPDDGGNPQPGDDGAAPGDGGTLPDDGFGGPLPGVAVGGGSAGSGAGGSGTLSRGLTGFGNGTTYGTGTGTRLAATGAAVAPQLLLAALALAFGTLLVLLSPKQGRHRLR